jgi:hypothetical protein
MREMPLGALVLAILISVSCARNDIGTPIACSTSSGRSQAILQTDKGAVVCLNCKNGEILHAWRYSDRVVGSKELIVPLRQIGDAYWYGYGTMLYKTGPDGRSILKRVSLFSGNRDAEKSVALMEGNDKVIVLGTNSKDVYKFSESENSLSLLVKGHDQSSGFWQMLLLEGDRLVTVGTASVSNAIWNRYESPRGLHYFTPDYQDGVCIWDLANARRAFRVDVDGRMDVSSRSFLYYEPPDDLYGGGFGDPSYLWLLDLGGYRILPPMGLFTRGPFVVHKKKVLAVSWDGSHAGLNLYSLVPLNSFDYKPLASWKIPGYANRAKLLGVNYSRDDDICVAYDDLSNIYGLIVDWQKNAISLLWTISSSSWQRRCVPYPHLVQDPKSLPDVENPISIDLEASLRAPTPTEYIPGEPPPPFWKKSEEEALQALLARQETAGQDFAGESPTAVNTFENALREYRSRDFTLQWAKRHDPFFYNDLVREGPAGWDAWRLQKRKDRAWASKNIGSP